MADTSLQVHTWITKALHTDVWVRATQNVDDAITKCSQFPIESAEGAKARRAQWETLVKVIETTETTVTPLRSRIHDIRTELALRVNAVLDPAKDRAAEVQRVLGAWDAQERVRVAALEAEQQRKRAAEAYRATVQRQDGDRVDTTGMDARVDAIRGSVVDVGQSSATPGTPWWTRLTLSRPGQSRQCRRPPLDRPDPLRKRGSWRFWTRTSWSRR